MLRISLAREVALESGNGAVGASPLDGDVGNTIFRGVTCGCAGGIDNSRASSRSVRGTEKFSPARAFATSAETLAGISAGARAWSGRKPNGAGLPVRAKVNAMASLQQKPIMY